MRKISVVVEEDEEVPFDQCSHLYSVRDEGQDLSQVIIKLSVFPVKYERTNCGYKYYRWVYADGKCDGNTAYALEQIIRAVHRLYEIVPGYTQDRTENLEVDCITAPQQS